MGTKIIKYGFMSTFKAQRQIYHLAGSVLSAGSEKLFQVYFIADTESRVSIR